MKFRIPVAALTLSAAAFVAKVGYEGYSDTAIIPVQNDRPTVGFGSTFHADGTPVKMGDRITPVRAVRLAATHMSKEERICRDSLPGVLLTQGEYDLYCGDWTYQYGSGAWLKSSMRSDLLAGSHYAACRDLLKYRKAGGYDCSTPFNKRCHGVWDRQLDRFAKCYAEQ